MADNLLEIVRESFGRCDQPELVRRFYKLFVASSPEVAEKFVETDFTRQESMLLQSLQTMLIAPEAEGEGALKDHLEHVARRHSHADLDIPEWMYELWLKCLLDALRETDPGFNPKVEHAWKITMLDGIEYIQSRY